MRAQVPKMKLDDVIEEKDEVARAIQDELSNAMEEYGYNIIKALITDIDTDSDVKNAMNRINATERNTLAAEYEGEAETESKKLQDAGIANQRCEIAKGLEESVKLLGDAGVDTREASAMIIVTQHNATM